MTLVKKLKTPSANRAGIDDNNHWSSQIQYEKEGAGVE